MKGATDTMQVETPSPVGERAKISLSSAAITLVLLIGAVFVGVAVLVGPEVVAIKRLANETRTMVIADSAETIQITAGGALGFMIVFAVAVGWLGRRDLVVPLIEASKILDQLSNGNTEVKTTPARLREFEAIRKSIESFREALVNTERLQAEQEAAKQRAEEEKPEQ